ncbi:hypothetical protein OROHE_008571 [Orobanche hederae]
MAKLLLPARHFTQEIWMRIIKQCQGSTKLTGDLRYP